MVLYNGQSGFAYYNIDSGAYLSNRSFPLVYNFGIWYSDFNQTITAYTLFLAQFINSMPTYTIGSPSVFQANATTSSTFSGQTTGSYNSTFNYQTYNIPIAPSTNYVTVLYNTSWIPSNIYPSTYLPIQNGTHYITIEDVKGFGSVQVTLIEPSTEIGHSTYQNIQYIMPAGITAPVDYFTNVITMTPFGSSSPTTIKTASQLVQIPYGSTVSISVLDPWGDQVGSVPNYLIANESGAISIPLNVTELQFDFFNSTANYVYLAHNGINESFFNSAIVANGTTFQWTTSYYSVTSGQQEFKSGSVTTDETIQPLLIYLKAPIGQLQVEVNAYSGSNLGTLSNSGNPRVESFINDQPYTLGTTFTGYQGSTYEIRIADLLNQTLLETNVTLQSSFTSLTETITTPSYWMGIENDEQLPQNSPLATEYVSLNVTGSSEHYNFTDSVGQNWIGYFLAGNYTVHMHDNVTNTFYVNISKSNQQFYLNGQALLNLTEFDAKINQLLNYTQSVANTTYGLRIVQASSTPTILTNQAETLSWNVFYNNYTSFPSAKLKNSTILVVLKNSTGSSQSFTSSSTVSGNTVTYTVTPTSSGSFSAEIDVIYGKYAGASSSQFTVNSPQKVSVGMSLAFGISNSLNTNQSYVVPLYLYYGNQTRFNLTDTALAFPYATLYVLQGNTVIHTYAPVNYSAGAIDFSVAGMPTGQYTFYAEVSSFNLSGSPVHAAITQTENIQPKTLSPLQSFEQFWVGLGQSIASNLLVTLIVTLFLVIGTFGLRYLIRYINRKLKRDKTDAQAVDNSLVASAATELTQGNLQSNYDLAAKYASLSTAQQDAFMRSPDGVVDKIPVKIGSRAMTLLDARNILEKMQNHKDGNLLDSVRTILKRRK